MYIIIAGGGKVGYYLAKELLADGHEILVIEKDPKQVMQLSAELGEPVRSYVARLMAIEDVLRTLRPDG